VAANLIFAINGHSIITIIIIIIIILTVKCEGSTAPIPKPATEHDNSFLHFLLSSYLFIPMQE
jgi:hypothetical protein